MQRFSLLFRLLFVAGLAVVAGCGGTQKLGSNTNFIIFVDRIAGDSMGDVYATVAPNEGSITSPTAASDAPSGSFQRWCSIDTLDRNTKEVRFRSNSTQVPYLVYLELDGTAPRTMDVDISVKGNDEFQLTGRRVRLVPGDRPLLVLRIFRNNVEL